MCIYINIMVSNFFYWSFSNKQKKIEKKEFRWWWWFFQKYRKYICIFNDRRYVTLYYSATCCIHTHRQTHFLHNENVEKLKKKIFSHYLQSDLDKWFFYRSIVLKFWPVTIMMMMMMFCFEFKLITHSLVTNQNKKKFHIWHWMWNIYIKWKKLD